MNNKKRLTSLESFRIIIAAAFLNRCTNENGQYYYQYSKTKMELDLYAVMGAMVTNIEGAFLSEYGEKEGTKRSLAMYNAMFDFDLSGHEPSKYKLTPLGNETMERLFSEMVEIFEANGFKIPTVTVH